MTVVRLLAHRSLRAHRTAWAAVFAAVLLTSTLLGATALTAGATALGHARVERYAAAEVVVAGDHTTRWRTEEFGGGTRRLSAGLTERVRLPARTVGILREVDGVAAVTADHLAALRVTTTGGSADGTARGRTVQGRPWPAAALAPHQLRAGRAPERADEVVAAAAPGAGIGDRISVRAGAVSRAYRIVGISGGPATVWFTTAEARRLTGRTGTADAVGVRAAPGVSARTLHGRVRAALDRAGVRDTAAGHPPRVLTGDGRGLAEHLGAAPARDGLLMLLAAVGGTLLLVSVLVIASLVAQALRQRADELDLLRKVGASVRQVRAAVGREVTRVAGAAALLGSALAVPAYLALTDRLRRTGVLDGGLVVSAPWWLFPGVLVTAALTVALARGAVATARVGRSPGRTAGRTPGRASGRTPVGTPGLNCRPPGRLPRRTAVRTPGQGPAPRDRSGGGRRLTGLVLLAAGASAAATATLRSGQTAAAMVSAAAVTMIAGCAVLGPWIARGALAVLGGPLRRLGPAGRLAAAASGTNAARLGAAITPVVLMCGFAAVQLSAGATLERAGGTESVQALRADFAVTGTTATALRGIPGVAAATDVLRSTVVLPYKNLGTPELERLPVLGVSPGAPAATLDPDLVEGDPGALGSPGTVAVGATRADALGIRVGSRLTLRMGDGTERSFRVAALHRRSLALGDFLFGRDDLARHMSAPVPDQVLVSVTPGAAEDTVRAAVTKRLPGTVTDPDPAPVRTVSEEERAGSAVSAVLVAAIGALTAVTVVTTLALITTGRREEIALLRRVGAERRQIRRMLSAETAVVVLTGLALGAVVALVPLLAFASVLTGSLPWLPPAQLAAIVAATVLTACAGTMLPARPSLRRRP
ncbi:FtsX-like permease family protein [Streptomyces sp. SID4919]|uniref:ABC transporter permease n=1 Tax=unclassified Streptomyces TaxID=2593676 RepID=UPI0008238F18|nr:MULTISPECIES: ABC transporter permease [unclassified Streptomyces]MYY11489.1 FtsX-like permease family protein [Streptomyces sp. SID4919]SCK39859.1 putative ABC transport system permease protein [Streptomyces sp. AmelKG-E11A]